eukprot:CCRYP_011678-RA/>CCRYP_011678-RA protein AED:0.26 eAED:0.20 QI:0/0/0/1/0/0/3/0/169
MQVYAQIFIECAMYMELPPGIETKHRNSKDYVLKIFANLYSQKQAGWVWNHYMPKEIRFQQSLIDKCVLYSGDIIFIVMPKNACCLLMMYHYGWHQRQNSYTQPVPAKVPLQLHAVCNSHKFSRDFNYCAAVEKLNYLCQTTLPDIMYTIHQVVIYSTDPIQEHGKAME